MRQPRRQGQQDDRPFRERQVRGGGGLVPEGADLNAKLAKPTRSYRRRPTTRWARRYGKTGKTKEAADAYEAAAKADPTKAGMYYFNEAATLFNASDMDGAAAAADKAIAADPTKADAYYIKGQALVQKATVDPRRARSQRLRDASRLTRSIWNWRRMARMRRRSRTFCGELASRSRRATRRGPRSRLAPERRTTKRLDDEKALGEESGAVFFLSRLFSQTRCIEEDRWEGWQRRRGFWVCGGAGGGAASCGGGERTEAEKVELLASAGRVLAEECGGGSRPAAVRPGDAGWVRGAGGGVDGGARLKVVGQVRAGEAWAGGAIVGMRD
jgi:hypothetical protein